MTTGPKVFAPAKVNLSLHVTGRRDDGYHLLDSLVVFAGVGDWLWSVPGEGPALTIGGPRAAGIPVGPDNLVLRAAALFDPPVLAALYLEKHLPAEAGIGGGSADAAAALKLLAERTGRDLPDPAQILALGADVPVCLETGPARMQGIGEAITRLAGLPPLWLVLANPGVRVSTPQVFRQLARRDTLPMKMPPDWGDVATFCAWLARQRNDLEIPARQIAPEIGDCLGALSARPGCQLARMSGSGATCFGLFADPAMATVAARALRDDHPGWWVAAAPVLS